MRKNLPITNNERKLSADMKLITITDKSGTIIDCNDAFVDISGFEKSELVGQPHNIVRHPDMPAAAFKVMWEHLKQGKAWMGHVKNRCKNGDFYWVDAYVTPISEHGKVVGYESVRVCPKRDDVARAEAYYAKLNKGETLKLNLPVAPTLPNILLLFTVLSTVFLYGIGYHATSHTILFINFIVYALLTSYKHKATIHTLHNMLNKSFTHDIAAHTYTKSAGKLGKLKVAILSSQAHLTTVITRIESAAKDVAIESEKGYLMTMKTCEQIEQQQAETLQVATAMNEMTTTISEVAKHVTETASHADVANELALKGNHVADVTRGSIQKLRDTVSDISTSVSEVSEQTKLIAKAAQIIEQIADQTNLLALNAAIEAARAGEQGRGFAVVAGEVRNLAQRTQESTSEIYDIIDTLTAKAINAVNTADLGTDAADEGLTRVVESAEMLNGISDAIDNIAQMSNQMSAAVEEQASVADEIKRQVVNISDLAYTCSEDATKTSKSITLLKNTSDQLLELVVRFK